MSKRPCSAEAENLGERAVRTKVSAAAAEEAQPAAATSADVCDDELDDLYGAAEAAQQQQQQPAPQPAAAAAQGAAPEEDDLDDLYGEADAAAAAKQQSVGINSRQLPVVAAAAAAAAAAEDGGGGGESADGAPAASQQPAAAATTTTATTTPPAPAAAAAAAPKPAAGGGRVPPTRVTAPDLPEDVAGVFSNAVLLVDKPKTWTSFDACNAIKKAIKQLGVQKVGHAGTLDPAATGLLIICTGQGTKSIEGFMAAHKEYSGTLKLGEGTPSLDADTEVEETLPWEHITDAQLTEAAQKLTGDIEQIPPMYSAIHHNGKRLHELARAGETVERAARPVTITRFDVHRDPDNKQLVHFYVGCTKGTYIRTLGHDLATSLGSTGHLVALRREAIGDARVDNAWQIQDLQDKLWAAVRARNPNAAAAAAAGGGSDEEGGQRPRGGGNRGRGRRRGKGGGGGGGGGGGSGGSGGQQQGGEAAAAAAGSS